jgi:hypothetical protein
MPIHRSIRQSKRRSTRSSKRLSIRSSKRRSKRRSIRSSKRRSIRHSKRRSTRSSKRSSKRHSTRRSKRRSARSSKRRYDGGINHDTLTKYYNDFDNYESKLIDVKKDDELKELKFYIDKFIEESKTEENNMICVDLEFDFKLISLITISFEKKDNRFIYMFDPPSDDKTEIIKSLKILFTSKHIIKLFWGGSSDIKNLNEYFKFKFEKDSDDKLIHDKNNLKDIQIIYKQKNFPIINDISKSTSLYDVLVYNGIIDTKKYKEIENISIPLHATWKSIDKNIKIKLCYDTIKDNKDYQLYCLSDVLYLKKLFYIVTFSTTSGSGSIDFIDIDFKKHANDNDEINRIYIENKEELKKQVDELNKLKKDEISESIKRGDDGETNTHKIAKFDYQEEIDREEYSLLKNINYVTLINNSFTKKELDTVVIDTDNNVIAIYESKSGGALNEFVNDYIGMCNMLKQIKNEHNNEKVPFNNKFTKKGKGKGKENEIDYRLSFNDKIKIKYVINLDAKWLDDSKKIKTLNTYSLILNANKMFLSMIIIKALEKIPTEKGGVLFTLEYNEKSNNVKFVFNNAFKNSFKEEFDEIKNYSDYFIKNGQVSIYNNVPETRQEIESVNVDKIKEIMDFYNAKELSTSYDGLINTIMNYYDPLKTKTLTRVTTGKTEITDASMSFIKEKLASLSSGDVIKLYDNDAVEEELKKMLSTSKGAEESKV